MIDLPCMHKAWVWSLKTWKTNKKKKNPLLFIDKSLTRRIVHLMLCLCPHPLEAVHLDLCTHKGWSRPRGRHYGGEGGSLCIFHIPEMCAKFCTPYIALQTLTSVLSAIPVGMAHAPMWLEVLNAIAMKALSRGPWWTAKASRPALRLRCLPLMYRMCFRNLYPSIAAVLFCCLYSPPVHCPLPHPAPSVPVLCICLLTAAREGVAASWHLLFSHFFKSWLHFHDFSLYRLTFNLSSEYILGRVTLLWGMLMLWS